MKEKYNKLTKEKKVLVITFAAVCIVFAAMAFTLGQTTNLYGNGSDVRSYNSALPTEYTSLANIPSEDESLEAIVKGSIYEQGDNMTVYGACFNNRGQLFAPADTKFTAWYPNGTIMIGPNASMDPITEDYQGSTPAGTGRWKIHVTMGDVVGTYLTEMRCEFNDQMAVAFGEWQNPAWVVRIATTEQRLINASNTLDAFQLTTDTSLQQIINTLNDAGGQLQISELQRQLADLDKNSWVLDKKNPFYVLNSDIHNFVAVDMLSDSAVATVSSDGYYIQWDGETWTSQNSTNTYRGVSLLPANQPYGWAVGTDGVSAVIAVNGGGSISNTPNTSATHYNDVKLFQDPLNPAGNYYAYLLDSDGNVHFSNTSSATWSTINTLDAANKGRISQVVENYGVNAQPSGYMVLVGQGSTVLADDSVTQQTFNVTGTVADVALLYHDYGYVVTKDATTLYIYKWNGTTFTEEFRIEDENITPVAVDVHSAEDVWVATDDPSSFVHFDGRSWQLSRVGFNDFITVLISFEGNASDIGIRDMRMVDSRHGYAVGGDGLILKYQSESQQQFNKIETLINSISENISFNINGTEIALETSLQELQNLTQEEFYNLTVYLQQQFNNTNTLIGDNYVLIGDTYQRIGELNESMQQQFNYTNNLIGVSIADINQSLHDEMAARTNQIITEINSEIYSMNATINANIDDLRTELNQMNVSMQFKLDNVLTNVTFTNQYLQTTIFPMLNNTYQNTLQILAELGIIQQQLNTTIEIANETRTIVNDTAGDVDILLNRSDRDEGRITAWITP